MLTLKRYFLKDNERYAMEEIILTYNSELSREEVYKMDDKELITMYKTCKNEDCIASSY
ncbi:hypothetical protein [Mesobacillus foraminis]|uniref:Fur-regulated basic protein A n=1 Tax=Mesobacillus foraminis TaxID=279826 RepID=A0A4R2BKH5_9BACI|nr:hypothetical protein [Mesobacillus foraminis]TCN27476.1 hypothetical protein EV146_102430 [Mesobacillus foraminis]